jgi:hypothetical protein
MRRERGQATVEWIGLVLLVALALGALSHLAPSADGRTVAASLLHSVTETARKSHTGHRGVTLPSRREASLAPPLVPRPNPVIWAPKEGRSLQLPELPKSLRRAGGLPELPKSLRRAGGLPELPKSLRRAGRGAGALWRRAWFACLVYERTRYALLHPESRLPGYTLPIDVALRMANNCISPVDLLRDWQLLDGDP